MRHQGIGLVGGEEHLGGAGKEEAMIRNYCLKKEFSVKMSLKDNAETHSMCYVINIVFLYQTNFIMFLFIDWFVKYV